MTTWNYRSTEERALLNPGFCANLLWHAALGYSEIDTDGLPFEETFLVLPFVLHRTTREMLPRDTRTSLAVWLTNNPLARGRIATRARFLIGFTKDGMLFSGVHGFIRIEAGRINANRAWNQEVNRSLLASSDEVRKCAQSAEFVGKWFALTGSALTVLALIGVQP